MRTTKEQKAKNEPSVEFDFAEVERLIDGIEAEDRAIDCESLAIAMHRLIKWVISGQLRGDVGMRRVARRAIALAWVIDPDLFGENSTLGDLAAHLGIHKMLLSVHTSEFSGKFGVRNGYQIVTQGY